MVTPPFIVVNDLLLRTQPRESLNRLCNLVDWGGWGTPLSDILQRELHESVTIHRNSWQFAMLIHGLRSLGLLTQHANGISVGAGSEPLLYWLANHTSRIVAVGPYENPHFHGQPSMLSSPESLAPFPYRNEHLSTYRMQADDLRFQDEEFDFAYCLSPHVHLGPPEQRRNSLAEIRRIVRKGGVIIIAAEVIINDSDDQRYFSFDEVRDLFLDAPGLELTGGELDLRIAESLVRYPVEISDPWDYENPPYNGSPHIVLSNGAAMWTSISLFLRRL